MTSHKHKIIGEKKGFILLSRKLLTFPIDRQLEVMRNVTYLKTSAPIPAVHECATSYFILHDPVAVGDSNLDDYR
jgi:hypothetical protein